MPSEVVGLVLAAGASRRMGPDTNKLCAPVDGEPLLAWAVDAMFEAGVTRVFVVTGFEATKVREVLGDRPCVFVDNPSWSEGMGASIAAGTRKILEDESPRGILVCVGDLPGLKAVWIEALLAEFDRVDSSDCLCVPTYQGRWGHPVLFGRDYFGALTALEGETGGRSILQAHEGQLVRIPIESDAILRDLDTPADFEAHGT